MSVISTERPHYFEGQFLGASDLTSALEYARTSTRRHALGGHTWGIAMGMELEESASPSGTIEVYVLPGFAWDGYGRQITALCPVKLDPAMFEGYQSGLVDVWLAYRESFTDGVRRGFEVCDAVDPFARVDETYKLVVGPRPAMTDRQEGVTVGGQGIQDPRDALDAFDDAAGIVCDASVPHQQFPGDDQQAAWLVPVGKVQWVAGSGGAQGAFGTRDDDALRQSRAFRRYAGVVTEGIQAADGLIRLRRRTTPKDPKLDNDKQCEADALSLGDFDAGAGATAIDDLVWVEGNLRVLGNERLWGTKLEFRSFTGADDGVPLYLRRGPDATTGSSGRDLEVALGLDSASQGKNRLVVGTVKPGAGTSPESVVPKVVVTDDSRVGIGNADPASFDADADDLVIQTAGATGLTLVSDAGSAGSIFFADGTGPAERDRGRIRYDQDKNWLSFGAGATDFVYLTANLHVGIGTNTPGDYRGDGDDLVLYTAGNTGLTIASGEQSRGHIFFADGTAGDKSYRGFVGYDHQNDSLQFGTAADTEMTISSDGNVGIGTDAPDVRLQVMGGKSIGLGYDEAYLVLGSTSDDNLALDNTGIQARSGGVTSSLELQPMGGDLVVHGSDAENTRVVVTDAGSVGIGTSAPANTLHVTNAIDETETLDGHVARMENTNSGSNGSVLALCVEPSKPGGHHNFVTFFGGTSSLGAIQGDGSGGVTYAGTGNDYAEFFPRLDPAEKLEAGDVVGVFGGAVSRTTAGAEQLLAVTDRPIVLANQPPPAQRDRYTAVAMVGQLPIRVRGKVATGDFLLASGENDGTAVAVAPGGLALADLPRIVGRAWEASNEASVKRVRCSICVQSGVLGAIVQQLTAAAAQPKKNGENTTRRKTTPRRRKKSDAT